MIDLPHRQIKLVRNNVGCEILLTGSGCHDATESKANTVQVTSKSVPIQFRKKSYDMDNSCVWLSACLLVNSVDREIADNIVEYYKANQEKYEWLDIFNQNKRSNVDTMIMKRSYLY